MVGKFGDGAQWEFVGNVQEFTLNLIVDIAITALLFGVMMLNCCVRTIKFREVLKTDHLNASVSLTSQLSCSRELLLLLIFTGLVDHQMQTSNRI